jgi:glutathione S-transferase
MTRRLPMSAIERHRAPDDVLEGLEPSVAVDRQAARSSRCSATDQRRAPWTVWPSVAPHSTPPPRRAAKHGDAPMCDRSRAMATLPAITLYQPPTRPWQSPNLSPFCSKLETYLRMAKIDHKVEPSDMRAAPKGKIPYVRIGDELMGDSQIIIERIESLRDEKMDAWLTDEQRAIGHATRRMLEEGLYFVVMTARWSSPWTSTIQREAFTKVLPAALRWAFPLIVRDVKKKLAQQGTGKHTHEEALALGVADLAALSTLLGDKRYLFGDRPCTVDASAFAFISGAAAFPGDSSLRSFVRAKKNLMEYEARMKAELFPELVK